MKENEPAEIKCNKAAAPFIPRMGMHRACVLDLGHAGECRPGGKCYIHGEFIGLECRLCVQVAAELVADKFRAHSMMQYPVQAVRDTPTSDRNPPATVRDLISMLLTYNLDAEIQTVVKCCPQPFEILYGGGDGCTKSTCDSVIFAVGSNNEEAT
jgi:hypothetical protein